MAALSGCQGLPSQPPGSPTSASTSTIPPEATRREADLALLVVTADDLALLGDVEYLQFDEGPVGRGDTLPPPRDDPERFGHVAGWKARYRPEDPSARNGLIVGSRIDSFQAAAGATSELGLIVNEAQARDASGAVRLVETDPIGDASIAFTYEQAAVGGDVAYYELYWRSGAYSASLVLSGFKGELSIDDVLLLARAVQARIAAASG